MTTLRDVILHIHSLASRDLQVFGHSGRIEIGPDIESEQEKTTIKRITVSSYPSSRAVTKASQDKSNLLLTSQPLFREPIKTITASHLTRVRLLVKNYISTYVIGSAWVAARDGIADALVKTLDLKLDGEFHVQGDFQRLVPLGRVCKPQNTTNHSGFANYIVDRMELESITFTGNLDADVKQVLVCPGEYLNIQLMEKARREGLKTVITGDVTPDTRHYVHNMGVSLYEIGSITTDEPGMKRLRHHLSSEFPEMQIDFAESQSFTQSLRPYS